MKRQIASLVAMALAATGGIAVAAHAAPQPAQPPTRQTATASPVVDSTQHKPIDEARRVMVLLKTQPTGKGDKAKGLAAVDRVIARWKDEPGFAVDRKFGMLVRGFSATIPQSRIVDLAADPDVASVKPVAVYYPTMQTAGQLTHSVQARNDLGVDGRGLVVSIIDTGIDIKHRDMRLDTGVTGRLDPAKGFTAKVPYGWNFADNNADVKDTGSQHGMHVAGIVAANGGADADVFTNGRIRGIAPNAQLLAMKVFSNDPKHAGAYEDDIIAAIEDSVARGANVINMSLGSANGTNESAVGEGRAIANAQKAGVQVIVAAGNDAINGSAAAGLDDALDMLDDGTLGSPASTTEALAVASVNNSQSIASRADIEAGGEKTSVGFQLQSGTIDGKAHLLVDGGLGRPEDIPATAKGNYVLIERGEISFTEKFINAINKGATGVLIFNNAAEGESFLSMAGLEKITIPGGFLYRSVGQMLKEKIAAGEVRITLTSEPKAVPIAAQMTPSTFTSWGATPELDFKPQLAGIGGQVYSTLNDNKYGEMSGTSMATPHVAGAFALGLQEFAKRFPDVSPAERNTLLRTALSNTATVLTHDDGVPFAPRQVGAGLIQTKEALTTDVFATVDGVPNVALRELKGAKKFTVTLTNRGKVDRKFSVSNTCSVKESQDPKANTTSCTTDDKIAAASSSVTVPANGTATVDFTVTPASGKDHWIQGWATFASSDKNQPSLSMPYLGFAGDWNAEPIIDAPRSTGKSVLDAVLGGKQRTQTALMGNYPLVGAVPTTWFSPNGDGAYDEVFPQLSMLRSAADLQFEVLRDGKVVATLRSDRDVQRPTFATTAGSSGSVSYVGSDQKWDGKVYDPKTDSFVDAPDGKYTYRVKARLGDKFAWQTLDLPFTIDRVAPTIQSLTHVANPDGSLTYTLKVSDSASGIFWKALVATDGATQKQFEKTIDEKTGTVTFTVPGDKVREGNYVEVIVVDNAGNRTQKIDFQGRESVQLLHGWLYNRWVNSDQYNVDTRDSFVVDGKVQLTVVATPSVASATVNGMKVELTDGRGTVLVPVKQGRNEFTLVGLAADGSEVGKSTAWLGVDDVAPKLEFTKVPLNDQGDLVPDANGKVRIEGRVTDEFSSASDKSLLMVDQAIDPVAIKADGTFVYETTVGKDQLAVSLAALDHFPDGLNVVTKSWPIAGRVTPASDLSIRFDDPRLNSPIKADQFGRASYVVDPNYQNLTITGETAVLHLVGTFNSRPGKFLVNGKEVTVDKNLRFDVPVTLKGGITNVGYEVLDGNGKRAVMSSWKFFFDRTMPGYEMVTTPAIDADGAIYLRDKEQKIDVKGAVWDSEFGYTLDINGNTVKNFSSLRDPGAKQNRRDYATTVAGKGGEMMRVSLFDDMGNGFERGIPLVYDEGAPTVKITGVSDGQTVDGKQVITVRATDPNLKSLTVMVDGKKYAGKVIATKMHPDAYLVSYLNGQADKKDAKTPGDTKPEVELTVEVTGLKAGMHTVEGVAMDKAGYQAVSSVTFTVDATAPVINGPDRLSVNPDADVLAQIRKAYTVTDDVDKNLQVSADISTLVPDKAVTLRLTVMDSSGKVTHRDVTVTLERPLTTLTGECGTFTARFAKGDSISITCAKQADGTTIVTVKNKAMAIGGTLVIKATGSPVYLLDEQGKVVSRVAATSGKGTITLQSSSQATYRIGDVKKDKKVSDDKQPSKPTTPTTPSKPKMLPNTGN